MHLMGGSLPPCRWCEADLLINAVENFWSRIPQLSVPFSLEDTPGCLTWPPILSRGKVFFLVVASLRKESMSEWDRCRIPSLRGLFYPNCNIPIALLANFCRFLTSNFSHISPLKKTCLSKDRWQFIANRLFRVPYSSSIYDFLIQFAESSNQNTYQVANWNWHLQIKLCTFCCAPPSRNSETCSCHSPGCIALWALWQGQLTLPDISLYDF